MKKFFAIVVVIVILISAFFGWKFYNSYYQSSVKKTGFILIPHNANISQVVDSIAPYLHNVQSFEKLAAAKKLDENSIKTGRYEIKEGASNRQLINMLKLGTQTANTFRIKDFDDVYQMIGRVARKTEADSLDFVQTFNAIARQKGLNNAEDLKPCFFANTYNFYWTITPDEFFKKFEDEYNTFWNAENIKKEKELGLTRVQVYALASIVQKESGGKLDEQRRIAGLYINRYHKGMKLQSDPTVIYSINKDNNFSKSIKRVYFKDLVIDSPYNTYKYKGIPPGPICIVNKSSVENVLNAEKNNFLFMVADTKKPGYHLFTDNAEEHERNAAIYRNWATEKQIK